MMRALYGLVAGAIGGALIFGPFIWLVQFVPKLFGYVVNAPPGAMWRIFWTGCAMMAVVGMFDALRGKL